MDRIVTDLGNIQVSLQEPELALYTQDGPNQSGDRDLIQFRYTRENRSRPLFGAAVKFPISKYRASSFAPFK